MSLDSCSNLKFTLARKCRKFGALNIKLDKAAREGKDYAFRANLAQKLQSENLDSLNSNSIKLNLKISFKNSESINSWLCSLLPLLFRPSKMRLSYGQAKPRRGKVELLQSSGERWGKIRAPGETSFKTCRISI